MLAQIALAITAGALLVEASARHEALARADANQSAPLATLGRVRVQLDNLGRGTAALADRGNANAAAIVVELRRRGIVINPDAPRAQP